MTPFEEGLRFSHIRKGKCKNRICLQTILYYMMHTTMISVLKVIGRPKLSSGKTPNSITKKSMALYINKLYIVTRLKK